MALDGIFTRFLSREIEALAEGAKVNQVNQPSRDELILTLHTRDGNKKLLISSRADTPRVSFTAYSAENPQTPPMFCMLLRKHLVSARLKGVRQHELERTVFFEFEGMSSIGDRTTLTLAVEIMGKHSNCILLDSEGIIIDAMKRVDMTLSSKRMVLPALRYELPPSQGKLSLLSEDAEYIVKRVLEEENSRLDKALLSVLMGASPVVCREISYRVTGVTDYPVSEMSEGEKAKLLETVKELQELVKEGKGTPLMLINSEKKPFDMSFMDVEQYEGFADKKEFSSFCSLLDEYYHTREIMERMKAHSRDLTKLVSSGIGRISRKLSLQMQELEDTQNREELRIKGDLIQANLYRIEKGAPFAEVENFYDENYSTIRIPLDPAKTPAQNSQKYYKDYARAKNADKILRVQIEKGKEELLYLESVLDLIERTETVRDLSQIKQELTLGGYLRAQKGKQKAPSELPPKEYRVSGDFTVLVGRNNRQNDVLTLKTARKSDLWFHTKDIPGSHTVLLTEGREVPEEAILEAAEICAFNSKAKESSQVPVDFTEIRYVSKPQGSPFGRVIYTHQHTVYVTPKSAVEISK